jgi:hypothetical protein
MGADIPVHVSRTIARLRRGFDQALEEDRVDLEERGYPRP